MNLTINKKNYPIKFDFNFQDLLCEFYGFERISELNNIFKQLDWSRGFTQKQIEEKTVDVSLCEPTRAEIKVFGEVVYHGLKSANDAFRFVLVSDVFLRLCLWGSGICPNPQGNRTSRRT